MKIQLIQYKKLGFQTFLLEIITSVRRLQSGYFHFLTQNEIQHNESGSESKKFPVQLRSLAAKEGIRAKQEISELESANTFEVPASKFAPQTHLS